MSFVLGEEVITIHGNVTMHFTVGHVKLSRAKPITEMIDLEVR
jgi:hypothetical protein